MRIIYYYLLKMSFSPYLQDSFWEKSPKISCSKSEKNYNFKMFSGMFFSKKFLWTHRMQFWQTCQKLFAQSSKIMRNNFRTFFSSKCSSGLVECSFDNHAGNFCKRSQTFFAEIPKIFKNIFFFKNDFFLPQKFFLDIIANLPLNASRIEIFLKYERN